MAGAGVPDLHTLAAGKKVVIIATHWHEQVMEGLIAGAKRACQDAKADWEVVRVPGSFELPLAAKAYAESGKADALVCLGVVIRGGTPHFDYVCDAATYGLTKVSVESAIPLGFGLLTCDNVEQALDRAGLESSHEDKGYEAVQAALAMVQVLAQAQK